MKKSKYYKKTALKRAAFLHNFCGLLIQITARRVTNECAEFQSW